MWINQETNIILKNIINEHKVRKERDENLGSENERCDLFFYNIQRYI